MESCDFMTWQAALVELESRRESCALVTIIGVEGSAPRDAGTKMVVSENAIYGSVGGGNLELTCINKARELMTQSGNCQFFEYYPLSAKFNQCCSGAVSVMFETFVVRPPKIVIFGAGHVAKELSLILPRLGFSLCIIDQRRAQLRNFENEKITLIHTENSLQELASIERGSYVLIMTHDHKLDFDLCCKALTEFDFKFFGLIGSQAKAEKFRLRMRNKDLKADEIGKLISPIGLTSVPGKLPMQVAVSVAAQLINLVNSALGPATDQQGITLKDTLRLKAFMSAD